MTRVTNAAGAGSDDVPQGRAQQTSDRAENDSYRLPDWAARMFRLLIISLLPSLILWAMAAGTWRVGQIKTVSQVDAIWRFGGSWALVGAGIFYAAGAFGAAVLILMASGVIGGAFGFLFGLPRMEARGATAEQERLSASNTTARISEDPPVGKGGDAVPSAPSTAAETSERAERRTIRTGFRMSPALNEIADWLTKIIVGLGLVQSGNISVGFGNAVHFLLIDAGLVRFPAAGVVVPAYMIIGVIGGFTLTYLLMTLLIGPEIARAADDLETAAELREREKRARQDAREADRKLQFAERQTRERSQVLSEWRTSSLADILSLGPDRQPPKVSDAARRFAEVDLNELKYIDEKRTWAKINVVLDRRELALAAYDSLLKADLIHDFRIAQEGSLLAQRLANSEAMNRFQAQIDKIRKFDPESIAPRDSIRFDLSQVEQNLYQDSVDGYENAINKLKIMESRYPSAEREPSFHVFWAAAIGQQYTQEKTEGKDDSALSPLVEEAVIHISKARAAGQTDWLQYLADPERGAASESRDNDLVEIAKVPKVKEAIGLR